MIKCKLITCSTDDNPAPAPAAFYFNAALSVGCEDGTTLNQCTAPASYPPGLNYNAGTKLVDVTAGIFRATTQTAANALATTYANTFIQNELDAGRMKCGAVCNPFIILKDDELTSVLNDQCENLQVFGTDLFWLPWGNTFLPDGFGIFHSTDGLNWSQIYQQPNGNAVEDIAFGNGVYVAVGATDSGDSVAYTSSDKTTWARQTIISTSTLTFWSVAFGNGVFVAVGNENTVAWSVDGMTWNNLGSIDAAVSNLYRVRFLNGNFYTFNPTTGKMFKSATGAVWSLVGTFTNPNDIAYGSGIYLLGTDAGIYSSADGSSFSFLVASPDGNPKGITYDGTNFGICTSTKKIFTSPDGNTWTDSGRTAAQSLSSIINWDGHLIAAEG